MTIVLIRAEEGRGGNVMTEAEIGTKYLQATEHQGLQTSPKARRQKSPSELPEGANPCQHLDFGLLAFTL